MRSTQFYNQRLFSWGMGLFFLLISWQLQAQTPVSVDSLYTRRKQETKKENPWTFAGNVSIQPSPLLINISPLIGYRLSENWIVGMGPSYQYVKDGLSKAAHPVKNTHIFGARAFAARRIYKKLFAQVETEAMNYPYYDDSEKKKRDWVVNPLAGLSYNLGLGKKAFFQLTVLYNFNYYNNSFNQQLYNSPWVFRLGAGVSGAKK